VRDLVSRDAAARDEQVVDVLRDEDPVGHLEVPAGGGQDEDPVAVDELGEDADRIREPGLAAHVVSRQLVAADDLA
jgi:hypothetical protein